MVEYHGSEIKAEFMQTRNDEKWVDEDGSEVGDRDWVFEWWFGDEKGQEWVVRSGQVRNTWLLGGWMREGMI